MSKTDHLAKAKDYLAKGDDYYAKAADEIAAWLDENASRTYQQAAERIGKHKSFVARLLSARNNCDGGVTQPDWASGSNKRDEVTATTLAKADDRQVKEIVAALPTEAVERVMHTATSALSERQRPIRESAPVGKSVERRLHDAAWQFWLIQDELQDVITEDEERVRMLGVVGSARTFLDAVEARLEHGAIDDDLAALLADAKGAA